MSGDVCKVCLSVLKARILFSSTEHYCQRCEDAPASSPIKETPETEINYGPYKGCLGDLSVDPKTGATVLNNAICPRTRRGDL